MKIPSIAIAIVLVACGKDAPPAAAPPLDGVKVVVAGSEPRTLLRYHVAKGTTNQIALALDVDIDAGGQGGPLPTLVMTSEVVADDVLPDGSTRVRTTITNVAARDRPGSPVGAEQMAEQTVLMRGLVLRGTLTPEGALREIKLDTAGKILPPALRTQLDTLSRSFEQVAMPLPRTPVGVGASWIHSKTFEQGGMLMTTTTTFSLTAIDGDTLSFQSATLVSGKDQAVTQGGTTIEVKNLSGKGSGKGTVDLSRMMMTGELVAELGSDMSAQGETTRMSMKMTTRVSPAPPPLPTPPTPPDPATPTTREAATPPESTPATPGTPPPAPPPAPTAPAPTR
jgi:hypothetical protein